MLESPDFFVAMKEKETQMKSELDQAVASVEK